jgi:hypothetical protein
MPISPRPIHVNVRQLQEFHGDQPRKFHQRRNWRVMPALLHTAKAIPAAISNHNGQSAWK